MSNSAPPPYHHGNLRPVLIAQARALLDAGGADAVSLRETARRAGVSATATYRHFADKDALLAAVAAEGFHEFGRALEAAFRGPAGFSGMGRAYVEFALANPGLFRLMFSPLLARRAAFPDLAAASGKAFDLLTSGAQTEPAAGRSVDATAISAWSLVHGLSHLLLDQVIPAEDAPALLAAIL